MRARGRGMTWWARTAQKSGSRLLPNAAVPVLLSSAFKERAMAPDEKLAVGAPWPSAKRSWVCGRSKSAKVRPPAGPNLLKCGSAGAPDLFAGDPPSRPTSRKKVMGLRPEQIC